MRFDSKNRRANARRSPIRVQRLHLAERDDYNDAIHSTSGVMIDMRTSTKQFALGAIVFLAAAAQAGDGQAVDIGARRELFVDDYLVQTLKGRAARKLHQPQRREIAVVHRYYAEIPPQVEIH